MRTMLPDNEVSRSTRHMRRMRSIPEVAAKIRERNRAWHHSEKGLATRRAYHLRNKEKHRKEAALWRKVNPIKTLILGAKRRAREFDLECNIEIGDLQPIPTICPVLGIPLMYGGSKACSNSASIDRIDNSAGYIKGNVVIVSLRANHLKRDASIEEMEKLVAFYRRAPCSTALQTTTITTRT